MIVKKLQDIDYNLKPDIKCFKGEYYYNKKQDCWYAVPFINNIN